MEWPEERLAREIAVTLGCWPGAAKERTTWLHHLADQLTALGSVPMRRLQPLATLLAADERAARQWLGQLAALAARAADEKEITGDELIRGLRRFVSAYGWAAADRHRPLDERRSRSVPAPDGGHYGLDEIGRALFAVRASYARARENEAEVLAEHGLEPATLGEILARTPTEGLTFNDGVRQGVLIGLRLAQTPSNA